MCVHAFVNVPMSLSLPGMPFPFVSRACTHLLIFQDPLKNHLLYYSAIKRNEVLISATTWTNLENVILSERSLTQKVTYCRIPFM